jgi:hypothetical protein
MTRARARSHAANRPFVALVSLLLLGSALVLTSLSAHAQWQWRDKNGRVTASDLPPPRDIPDKDILQRPDPAVRKAPAAAPAASAALLAPGNPAAETDLEKRRKATEQEQAAKVKAEEEKLAVQRRENCGRARNQLTTLESGQRVARVNDKGEREFLDDKARASETQRARDAIASDCR